MRLRHQRKKVTRIFQKSIVYCLMILMVFAPLLVRTESVQATSVNDYPWADAVHVSQPPAYDNITWGYTDKATCDNKSSAYDCGSYKEGAYYVYDQWNYYLRNCTSYVAWRVAVEFGVSAAGMGNATNWDNAAPGKGWSVDTTPEVGDIAQWEGAFGHVAFVESINADGSVNISEFNSGLNGNPGTRNSVRADHYIDINGTGGGGGGGQTSQSPIVLLDFANSIWAKPSVDAAGFTQETGSGSAKAVSAGGNRQTLIDFCDAIWSKDGVSNGGWTKEANCGSAQDVVVSSNGTRMLRDSCGAVWSKSTGLGVGGWNPETGCDGHKAIAAGGDKRLLLNACDAVYAKQGPVSYGSWTQETGCGAAKKIAVGADGTQMLLDYCGRVWAKNGIGFGGWNPETGCDGIKDIAIGSNGKQVILNACGGVWARQGIGMEGWQWETNCDSAKAIAVGSNDMPILISLDDAVWARTPYGWVAQTGPGSAKAADAG